MVVFLNKRPGHVTRSFAACWKLDLLRRWRLLRDDDRHDQIHNRDSAEAGEECQDREQTDDGGIDAEIVAQACTYAREHAVGGAAC